MLHFQSFSPIAYKRSVVIGATSRTKRICSSDTVDEELGKLKEVLSANGYPTKFIEANMRRERKKTEPPTPPETEMLPTCGKKRKPPSARPFLTPVSSSSSSRVDYTA
ncbi:Alpha-(1,6)-fucosyltransferase [Cichlidogyrus casuarinus]|uniref:Alpha-(1,6)-fucosyltransferase n=1 Tax=Cichlidogyrus casuarinus TaxID=1844966 RepID=A0ABD2PXD6_9PLAT